MMALRISTNCLRRPVPTMGHLTTPFTLIRKQRPRVHDKKLIDWKRSGLPTPPVQEYKFGRPSLSSPPGSVACRSDTDFPLKIPEVFGNFGLKIALKNRPNPRNERNLSKFLTEFFYLATMTANYWSPEKGPRKGQDDQICTNSRT